MLNDNDDGIKDSQRQIALRLLDRIFILTGTAAPGQNGYVATPRQDSFVVRGLHSNLSANLKCCDLATYVMLETGCHADPPVCTKLTLFDHHGQLLLKLSYTLEQAAYTSR